MTFSSNCSKIEMFILLRKFQNSFSKMTVKIAILDFHYFWNFYFDKNIFHEGAFCNHRRLDLKVVAKNIPHYKNQLLV